MNGRISRETWNDIAGTKSSQMLPKDDIRAKQTVHQQIKGRTTSKSTRGERERRDIKNTNIYSGSRPPVPMREK